ncbi:MAG TPA: hypothetical protein EYH41_04470 [Novosphingobium capsulatum]|nr:hypothetical protein [Novosphingobium capsulatum]
MGLFSRRAPAAPVPIPAPMAPTASDHARALGQVGRDARKARVRATTREICARIGMPVPVALQDKDA